jgi:hypothetical protein
VPIPRWMRDRDRTWLRYASERDGSGGRRACTLSTCEPSRTGTPRISSDDFRNWPEAADFCNAAKPEGIGGTPAVTAASSARRHLTHSCHVRRTYSVAPAQLKPRPSAQMPFLAAANCSQ